MCVCVCVLLNEERNANKAISKLNTNHTICSIVVKDSHIGMRFRNWPPKSSIILLMKGINIDNTRMVNQRLKSDLFRALLELLAVLELGVSGQGQPKRGRVPELSGVPIQVARFDPNTIKIEIASKF